MASIDDIRTRLYRRYEEAVGRIQELSKSERTTLPTISSQSPSKHDQRLKASLSGVESHAGRLLDMRAALQDHRIDIPSPDRQAISEGLESLIKDARDEFYAHNQDQLPPLWRDIFSDAHVMKTYHRLLSHTAASEPLNELLDFVSDHLDRAVIVAGKNAGSLGSKWMDDTMILLEEWESQEEEKEERPAKRARLDKKDEEGLLSNSEPFGRPATSPEHDIPRHKDWTLKRFEDYVNDKFRDPRPVIFTDQILDWPALTDTPWRSRDYLLSKTFRGRRLVPVEIGRSYVDEGWGQELVSFRAFLERYIDPPSRADDDPEAVGYLAQHDLFQQIPSLRKDITIPDYCWASVPLHPTDSSANKPTLEYPQLNAWFGPPKTITPLHTDGYHNLLCQVVGTKYVRLHPPWVDKEIIRPRGEEMGVSMENTSELDVGVLEGWDEPGEGLDQIELEAMRDDLKDVEYWEGVLEPGDTLLIPIGWWHYVRSLSVSFSVSFWWNGDPSETGEE